MKKFPYSVFPIFISVFLISIFSPIFFYMGYRQGIVRGNLIMKKEGRLLSENVVSPEKLKKIKLSLINGQFDYKEKGQKVFSTYCASCHGDDGGAQTVIAKTLKPPPRSFLDKGEKWTRGKDIFSLYQTLYSGIESTGMTAFSSVLNSKERWSVIHYLRDFEGLKNYEKTVEAESVLEKIEEKGMEP